MLVQCGAEILAARGERRRTGTRRDAGLWIWRSHGRDSLRNPFRYLRHEAPHSRWAGVGP